MAFCGIRFDHDYDIAKSLTCSIKPVSYHNNRRTKHGSPTDANNPVTWLCNSRSMNIVAYIS